MTRFPRTITTEGRLIRPSRNKKLGKRVTRGRWAGMPLYGVTLVEYGPSCPPNCYFLRNRTCFGNNMPFAARFGGTSPESYVHSEVGELARRHPRGFVVRLHILGGFPSVEYAWAWHNALALQPAVRVFGYTAHSKASSIGHVIRNMNAAWPDRCVIRWSGRRGPLGALRERQRGDAFTCPEQVGLVANCGDCAACWQSTKAVRFLEH